MKNTRRWLSLALAAALALCLAVPALAANFADPADTAAAFMAMLDAEGIEYSDNGFDVDGDYSIEIVYPSDSREEDHTIRLYIDESGAFFSAYEWYLLEYDGTRLEEVLTTVNELNRQYRFVTFLADTSDNTITAKTYGALQGDAEFSAGLLYYAYDYLPIIVDDAWTALVEGIPAVENAEPASVDYTGTWVFSSMTFTAEINGLPAGTELTAEDFGTADVFVMELTENGEMKVNSFGIKSSGTWALEGDTLTLSDDTGDFTARLQEDGTLRLDAEEDGGYTMILTREE